MPQKLSLPSKLLSSINILTLLLSTLTLKVKQFIDGNLNLHHFGARAMGNVLAFFVLRPFQSDRSFRCSMVYKQTFSAIKLSKCIQ